MSGEGSRFFDSEYNLPKPLIIIDGKPMYQLALESLGLKGELILVSRKGFRLSLVDWGMPTTIIEVESTTSGPATSAMLAEDLIDSDVPLVILNADQIVEWDSSILKDITTDGALLLFKSSGTRWSYADVVGDRIVKVVEKQEISHNALAGVHYWKRGSDFVRYAKRMFAARDSYHGEYYVAPVYQYALNDGLSISPVFVDRMHDSGTPEALKIYTKTLNES